MVWAPDDTVTTRAGSLAISRPSRGFVNKNGARWLRANLCSNPSAVKWRCAQKPPTLLTRTSSRGVARIFEMEFTESWLSLLREDSDFHQRFEAQISEDRIEGRWEASEDEGKTWRRDFDLLFEQSRWNPRFDEAAISGIESYDTR